MKKINAFYDDKTVRVYQAFNAQIAEEAARLNRFGAHFRRGRMTWIKPSFLWIMYRSGWAEKENQEHILAIDITREGFEEILRNAVLSTFHKELYASRDEWKELLRNSEVRCQFDPDRDFYGNPQEVRAIQLGLRGSFVDRYVDEWTVKITDITEEVKRFKIMRDEGTLAPCMLPQEREYHADSEIKKILCMED